jgi:hypothetical protein
MKMTASNPILSTRSCSLTSLMADTQLNGFLPSGIGRCFSSACLARGAYTRPFLGRKKQKRRKRTPASTKLYTMAAYMEFCWTFEKLACDHL